MYAMEQPTPIRPEQAGRGADLQFAQQVESVFGVPYIMQKLDEHPEKIRHQQKAIQAVDQAVAEMRDNLEFADAVLRTEIANAVNKDTGKPVYGNEDARKNELICRRRASTSYRDAAQALKAAESALQSARFDYDCLVNEFSAARSQARLAAGRLGLLGRG